MLRRIRITLAAVVFVLLTALFLDYTGTLHHWLGWLAKIQFLPALLSLNVGVVLVLVLLTLVFGRVYCSVICPLGIFQDIISWFSGLRKRKKYRFSHSPAKSCLRYTVLVLFVVAMIAGVGSFVALLAPYSAYGRMVQNLLMPLCDWANNGIAYFAERAGSYAVYSKEVWVRGWLTFGVALTTFVVLFVLAWRNGRTYCNTVCPVGTMLGFLARFSWFRVRIDTDKCNGCRLCERSCKAACIDAAHHTVDYSRCVSCGNCLDTCRRHAIRYTHTPLRTPAADTPKASAEPVDTGRRSFLVGTAIAMSATALAQEKKKIDGGLAAIEDKVAPKRLTPITPPGSLSAQNMAKHCTACQLCVSACPNDVLRPSQDLLTLMQPVMSYERGYCRPECTRCSEVCPAGAIRPITREDKSATQVGHAVWVRKNCVPLTDDVECGNCARHCPSGAITMVHIDGCAYAVPSVNTERCIGCGACENLCPARPFSAIYVEGNEVHRTI